MDSKKLKKCPICNNSRISFSAYAYDTEYQTSSQRFEYDECFECGGVFLNPPLTNRLQEIYPPNYYSYKKDKGSPANLAMLLEKVKRWLDGRLFRRLSLRFAKNRTLKILDVGGGTGWLLSVLRSQISSPVETHIVDLDAGAREQAESDGHVFHQGDISSFNSSEKFEFILLLNLIEHVANPGKVLSNIAQHLTEDGLLLIKTPNIRTLDYRLFRKYNWGGYHCPRHWVLFHAKNFKELATSSGLCIEEFWYSQGAPQVTTSILGLLVRLGVIKVSANRPMYKHWLYAPTLLATAIVDYARLPFMKTAQMFFVLRKRQSKDVSIPGFG